MKRVTTVGAALTLAIALPLLGTMRLGSAASAAGTTGSAWKDAHGPIMMFNIKTTDAINGGPQYVQPAVQPPPVLACLPVNPPSPVPGCVPPAPPAGEPWPGNMAYFGGHVQTTPHIYMVYYGWGVKGAWAPTAKCQPAAAHDPVPCDPDGAGLRMLQFVQQMGGTAWAGVSTQYYQTVTDKNGNTITQYVQNPANQFAGVWYDNSTADLGPSLKSGSVSYTQLAQEAARAAQHFHVSGAALLNAQFVIAQPHGFQDQQASSVGYCAWHDYTEPGIEGGIYNGVTPNISFTNMPYILDQGTSCGENAINAGSAGTLDGESIVLGHEIEETVTDPGAEDVINGQNLGGWYDINQYEIGDKCAWVGSNITGVGPNPYPGVPGEVGTMKGNLNGKPGMTFPVQSLWSNNAAGGAGYCAGAGTDLGF